MTLSRLSLAALLALPLPALAGTGRIAVMSAFPPEWVSLQADLEGAETQIVNGTEFVTGTLSGLKPVGQVDGRTIGSGARGPVTERLQGLYADLLASEAGQ